MKAWLTVLILLFGGLPLFAAEAGFTEGESVSIAARELSPQALEELVGPIALYPDDLLAIVLPAATYPLQIVQASRFLEERAANASLKPDPAWDDSVVALLNYPEALQLLNDDLDWSWQLGQAVLERQPDVIDAVSRFRDRARVAGNLDTDERQVVEEGDDGRIYIKPAAPDVVYVPYYEPSEVTVYQRVPVYHYYTRAYPSYYYPYPDYYAFHWPHFWGITSVFSIGWSTHHLHVHHHGFNDHPYYGYRYYGDRHYYHRWAEIGYRNDYQRRTERRARPHDRGHARPRQYDGNYWRADQRGRNARPFDRSRRDEYAGRTERARDRDQARGNDSDRDAGRDRGRGDREGSERTRNGGRGGAQSDADRVATRGDGSRGRAPAGEGASTFAARQERATSHTDATSGARSGARSGALGNRNGNGSDERAASIRRDLSRAAERQRGGTNSTEGVDNRGRERAVTRSDSRVDRAGQSDRQRASGSRDQRAVAGQAQRQQGQAQRQQAQARQNDAARVVRSGDARPSTRAAERATARTEGRGNGQRAARVSERTAAFQPARVGNGDTRRAEVRAPRSTERTAIRSAGPPPEQRQSSGNGGEQRQRSSRNDRGDQAQRASGNDGGGQRSARSERGDGEGRGADFGGRRGNSSRERP